MSRTVFEPVLPPPRLPLGKRLAARWRRSRRFRTLTVAGVVVLPVMVVVNALVVWPWESTPERVVRDYLEALQDADTERALDIAWPFRADRAYGATPPDYEADDFLNPSVLNRQWRIDRVEQHPVNDTTVNVDVTISAGDSTGVGRFSVVNNPDSGWVIGDPYTHVDIAGAPMDFTDLNGVTAELAPGDDQTFTLFPGVYQPYPDDDWFTGTAFVALPGVEIGLQGWSSSTKQTIPAGIALTESGATAVQDAVEEFLDDCAESTAIDPADCPFGHSDSDIGGEYYSDITDVSWTITDYPEVIVEPGAEAFSVYSRTQPLAEVTGTGEHDDHTESFTAYCEIDMDDLAVSIGSDHTINVTTNDAL